MHVGPAVAGAGTLSQCAGLVRAEGQPAPARPDQARLRADSSRCVGEFRERAAAGGTLVVSGLERMGDDEALSARALVWSDVRGKPHLR